MVGEGANHSTRSFRSGNRVRSPGEESRGYTISGNAIDLRFLIEEKEMNNQGTKLPRCWRSLITGRIATKSREGYKAGRSCSAYECRMRTGVGPRGRKRVASAKFAGFVPGRPACPAWSRVVPRPIFFGNKRDGQMRSANFGVRNGQRLVTSSPTNSKGPETDDNGGYRRVSTLNIIFGSVSVVPAGLDLKFGTVSQR
jgi:hypothetical protein